MWTKMRRNLNWKQLQDWKRHQNNTTIPYIQQIETWTVYLTCKGKKYNVQDYQYNMNIIIWENMNYIKNYRNYPKKKKKKTRKKINPKKREEHKWAVEQLRVRVIKSERGEKGGKKLRKEKQSSSKFTENHDPKSPQKLKHKKHEEHSPKLCDN